MICILTGDQGSCLKTVLDKKNEARSSSSPILDIDTLTSETVSYIRNSFFDKPYVFLSTCGFPLKKEEQRLLDVLTGMSSQSFELFIRPDKADKKTLDVLKGKGVVIRSFPRLSKADFKAHVRDFLGERGQRIEDDALEEFVIRSCYFDYNNSSDILAVETLLGRFAEDVITKEIVCDRLPSNVSANVFALIGKLGKPMKEVLKCAVDVTENDFSFFMAVGALERAFRLSFKEAVGVKTGERNVYKLPRKVAYKGLELCSAAKEDVMNGEEPEMTFVKLVGSLNKLLVR